MTRQAQRDRGLEGIEDANELQANGEGTSLPVLTNRFPESDTGGERMIPGVKELTAKALKEWGSQSQLDMVIEECSELINAIQKWRRSRVDSIAVLEEGVDVELCIEQLKLMLDAPVLWDEMRNKKLARLRDLLAPQKC